MITERGIAAMQTTANDEIKIRTATPEDAEALAAIYAPYVDVPRHAESPRVDRLPDRRGRFRRALRYDPVRVAAFLHRGQNVQEKSHHPHVRPVGSRLSAVRARLELLPHSAWPVHGRHGQRQLCSGVRIHADELDQEVPLGLGDRAVQLLHVRGTRRWDGRSGHSGAEHRLARAVHRDGRGDAAVHGAFHGSAEDFGQA